MSEMYKLPDEFNRLSDDDLAAHLAAAVKSFSSLGAETVVGPDHLANLRGLRDAIASLKGEQAARLTAAEEVAAEIDALNAEVFGEETEEVVAETEELGSETEETAAETEEAAAETVTAAAPVRRPALDLSAVRKTSTRVLSGNVLDPKPGIEIVASVDVPGYRPGQSFDLSDVTEGVMRRATGLKTAGGGVGQVASYTLPFSNDLVVRDSSSAPEGSTVLLRATDQRRLKGGDLVASGGWCSPSETVYDITDIACPDMLWDAPEVMIERGGLRFFRTPALDVNALTWIHTEANDIANAEKPCFHIPCPAPVEVRADAIGVCLEAGILTQRFFPELISWYVRNSMVAHEIRLKTEMYNQARTASTAVTTTASFAAFSAVFAAVALQAADMTEKLHLCDRIGLEVVFPWWTRNMFLADIARQQGVNVCDLDVNCIQDAFSTIGVKVQWARGLTPDVPTNIGGPVAAVAWPADMEFLIYPTGTFVIGRGPTVDLGVIYDSSKFTTNDYTALFTEEAAMLAMRGVESRRVTVTVCPNGAVGPNAASVCPIS